MEGLSPIYRTHYLDPMSSPEIVDPVARASSLWVDKDGCGDDTLYCLGTGPCGGDIVWKNSRNGWIRDNDTHTQQILLTPDDIDVSLSLRHYMTHTFS